MFDELIDFKIYLMSGTGNSFAITNFMSKESAETLHKNFDLNSQSELAKKICQLVKVDGFIIITEAENKANDYKWVFFNADGSPAEMCGNAARCVGHLCFKNHLAGQEHSFESTAGEISVFVDCEAEVRVTMTAIFDIKPSLSAEFNGSSLDYTYLNTGVPHCVFKIENFSEHRSYTEFAEKLRGNLKLYPEGSNITFFSELSPDKIQSVSFERGVENFTEACGTGAVAAAYCQKKTSGSQVIEVQMPGGTVSVDFSGEKPYLIGPITYNSTLFAEEIEDLWKNLFTD